jgi:paired amphipathic helix protein Sin3a
MTGQSMLLDAGRGQKRSFGDVLDAPTPIAFPQTPEVYVYNSAVERQFFDAAKEALASYTRDGGQAWAEFMKCLDMYAQEILSRSEMLNFVEPLLGKRNNKLFEEFKRILAAAGGRGTSTAPPMEDSWYSVPLSEIDFSRCRRCSPSYRALPRDYPAPPCSQRSDEESKVLNDVWVSLPVGSEESYTFRHMRRNTYEETLFRVEDERFEIDMAIDSNLCTLALLEPFAEEMAMLSVNDLQTQVDQDNDPKPGGDQKGLGGKYFRYTFDPKILGVIHRNSITRIYAEQGPEMLELLKNNPSVAIPIVVRRLRQKDEEWRRVRDRLNRHWKELAENNYYKSLDHRSLTWRTTDKRAISTRTLISEIKDRAANEGNEGHAALQARIDKAKEEHGSFYEVTMAKALRRKLDLSNLPKPDRRLFTPHMSFIYENNSWVQRDAYRILSFALERGSISPTDKERCHRLWTEFLGPWFSLSLNWMLSPAVNFLESSSSALSQTRFTRVVTEDDGSPDEEDSLPDDVEMNSRVITEDARGTGCDDKDASSVFIDHHPLPVGSTVSTLYGEGRVLQCRKEDGMYEVKLPLGNAFLRPSAVLCSILSAEKSAYTTQRRNDDRTKLDRPDDKLVIGTQGLYLFFRLHQILCRRLGIAKRLAYEVKHDASLQTLVEQMPGNVVAVLGRRRYDAFLALVYALLDGGTGNAAEGGKYEDRVRSLLGHGGYELATMDKLISHILKNIQSMANDDTMWSLVQLFRRHADAGGFKPEALRQEAAYLSDGEQMYAFQVCPVHKDGGDKSVLYMEYLGVISGSEDEDGSLSEPAIEPLTKRQKR